MRVKWDDKLPTLSSHFSLPFRIWRQKGEMVLFGDAGQLSSFPLSPLFSSSTLPAQTSFLHHPARLSVALSPPKSSPAVTLSPDVLFSKAMDALSSFFGSQSASRNRWSYDSLKNLGQISPVVQTHLKQVLIFSKDLACWGFVWFLGQDMRLMSLLPPSLSVSRTQANSECAESTFQFFLCLGFWFCKFCFGIFVWFGLKFRTVSDLNFTFDIGLCCFRLNQRDRGTNWTILKVFSENPAIFAFLFLENLSENQLWDSDLPLISLFWCKYLMSEPIFHQL